MFIKKHLIYTLAITCLLSLLMGCSGETYMPENEVIVIYTYDENTNSIAGLKVTFFLTTNGVVDTDIKFTDTNGYVKSKVFTVDYRALKLDDKPYQEKLKVFKITIEDIDGITNGGEFITTNLSPYDNVMKIFMQRK